MYHFDGNSVARRYHEVYGLAHKAYGYHALRRIDVFDSLDLRKSINHNQSCGSTRILPCLGDTKAVKKRSLTASRNMCRQPGWQTANRF